MWFRLALALSMTVAEAQARISSPEFAEWVAYYGLEPFGALAEDTRHGIRAAIQANAFRGKGKAATPADFMLCHTEKPAQSVDEMKARLMLAAKLAKKAKAKRGSSR